MTRPDASRGKVDVTVPGRDMNKREESRRNGN